MHLSLSLLLQQFLGVVDEVFLAIGEGHHGQFVEVDALLDELAVSFATMVGLSYRHAVFIIVSVPVFYADFL